MRSKSTCLFFVTILLASCAAPIPQPTVTAVPTSTRAATPIPTATRTPKPPSDSEPSWIRNDDELFIFDPVSSEWIRAAQDADTDLPVYEADGKKIILVGDEWLAVTIEAGADNKITATTEDGKQWVWGEQGWEAVHIEQVASMAEMDYSLLWEKGAVIEVDDYWGAGRAVMTVEDTKGGTEALTYEKLRVTPASTVVVNGIEIGGAGLQFMKIEEMALVKVDLADNTRISDGYQLVMRLGTIDTNGEQISFEVISSGDLGAGIDPQEIFSKMKRGDSVRMGIVTVLESGVTIDDTEKAFIVDSSDRLRRSKLFNILGFGSEPVSLADLRRIMREGGVLSSVIHVGGLNLDNP